MPIKFSQSLRQNCWAYRQEIAGEIKATILAAGIGSRLSPLTGRHVPKPMFPLGGKAPITEVWVRNLVESGITNISMNLCVLKDTIRRHFQDGAKFGANITYVEEDEPSGTLGGVCKQGLGAKSKKILPSDANLSMGEFHGSTVIVPGGDIVTNFGPEQLEEMYAIHKKVGAAFSIVLAPIPWGARGEFGTAFLEKPENRKGMISKSGRIKKFIEKDPNSPSNLNNASIYMIEMELIRFLDSLRTEASLEIEEPFYDFGKHVFPAMSEESGNISLPKKFILWGIQYDGLWFDVGRKRDYLRVNESILDGELKVVLPYEKFSWGYLGAHVDIDFSRVDIEPPVVIGNNCIIRPGAKIGPYAVIGDGWAIKEDVRIKHAVLWERYPFFSEHGKEISSDEREGVDPHEVLPGVTIEESIIAGGSIGEDIFEKTIDILENGEIEKLPLDWVPDGPRA
jgi:mannose-1-phosphate guanylyltransferase/phosphomannomutase